MSVLTQVFVDDLGTVGYNHAYEKQIEFLAAVSGKKDARVLFCEHLPVITYGRSFRGALPHASLGGWECVKTDRGGDITAHFPGQLVAYFIFDLKQFEKRLVDWMKGIQAITKEAISDACGICLDERPDDRGLWKGKGKVVSFGVACRRWVVYHGAAITYTYREDVNAIVKPCGDEQGYFEALDRLLGKPLDREALKYHIVNRFLCWLEGL